MALPFEGTPRKVKYHRIFDNESGNSISVIMLQQELFDLFQNGKVSFQVKEMTSGKEKIKTEWVDFNNEKSSKRETCVIS